MRELAPLQREQAPSGLLRRASIELDEPLSWQSSSKGQRSGKMAYFQSLSSVDVTEIPGPAVPVRRNQLVRSYFRLDCRTSSECVSHEHDDRQALGLPTRTNVALSFRVVTDFFKRLEVVECCRSFLTMAFPLWYVEVRRSSPWPNRHSKQN